MKNVAAKKGTLGRSTKLGRVLGVSLSPVGGVPKQPQGSIKVGPYGVEGDYHAGPINKHKKTGDPEPNWRQITLVASEVLADLSHQLQIELRPGDLGENILVSGMGDLSQLQKGDRLLLGSEVVLEVTAQNRPCDTIRVHHQDLVEAITGRRGVSATVASTGVVKPGDAIRRHK